MLLCGSWCWEQGFAAVWLQTASCPSLRNGDRIRLAEVAGIVELAAFVVLWCSRDDGLINGMQVRDLPQLAQGKRLRGARSPVSFAPGPCRPLLLTASWQSIHGLLPSSLARAKRYSSVADTSMQPEKRGVGARLPKMPTQAADTGITQSPTRLVDWWVDGWVKGGESVAGFGWSGRSWNRLYPYRRARAAGSHRRQGCHSTATCRVVLGARPTGSAAEACPSRSRRIPCPRH